MALKVLIAIYLAYCCMTADSFYTKVIHNTDNEARCLDGSSPMVYLHEGGDKKNIMFYFLGGGSCADKDIPSTLQSCYKRSKGQFGTSKNFPNTTDFFGGILETRQSSSKFSNWTKIIIMYCDGAFHQGNNKSPIKYKETELYFRGAVNTRSHIKWAHNKYNLTQAQRIVVSGSSAGGMATYLWVDYVRTLVQDQNIVYGVADSGIFYIPFFNSQLTINDTPNPIQILMKLSNVDQKPPNKECSDLLDEQENWKCISIQFSYATLRSPLLFVQSSYDQIIINGQLNINCLTYGNSGFTLKNCNNLQLNEIELYHSLYVEKFVPNLLKWGHSLWSISCSWHAQIYNTTIYDSNLQRVPKEQGPTLRNAVQSFVFDKRRIVAVDLFPWPANTPCAY